MYVSIPMFFPDAMSTGIVTFHRPEAAYRRDMSPDAGDDRTKYRYLPEKKAAKEDQIFGPFAGNWLKIVTTVAITG